MYQHPIQLHEIHCPLKIFFSLLLLKNKILFPCHLIAYQEVIICWRGGGDLQTFVFSYFYNVAIG